MQRNKPKMGKEKQLDKNHKFWELLTEIVSVKLTAVKDGARWCLLYESDPVQR